VPNWCNCELYAVGDKESMFKFEDEILQVSNANSAEKYELGNASFKFNDIVPMPEELHEENIPSLENKQAIEALVKGSGNDPDPATPLLVPNYDGLMKKYPVKNVLMFNDLVFKKAVSSRQPADSIASEWLKKVNREQDLVSKYGHSDWYSWRIENWGTKWEPTAINVSGKYRDLDSSKFLMEIWFDTAWAPPIPIISKLSNLYESIEFCLKCWEGGAGFKGIYHVKAGDVLRNETLPYSGPRGG
jgi:hypothetical protein